MNCFLFLSQRNQFPHSPHFRNSIEAVNENIPVHISIAKMEFFSLMVLMVIWLQNIRSPGMNETNIIPYVLSRLARNCLCDKILWSRPAVKTDFGLRCAKENTRSIIILCLHPSARIYSFYSSEISELLQCSQSTNTQEISGKKKNDFEFREKSAKE